MPNLIYVGVDADSLKLPTGTYIVKEQNKTKKNIVKKRKDKSGRAYSQACPLPFICTFFLEFLIPLPSNPRVPYPYLLIR